MDRRDFLKGIAVAGLAAAGGEQAKAQEAPEETRQPSPEAIYPNSEKLSEVDDIAAEFIRALAKRFAAEKPAERGESFWRETDHDLAAYALAYAKTYFPEEFSNTTPVPLSLFHDAMDSLYEAADELRDAELRMELRTLLRKEKVAAKKSIAKVLPAPAPASDKPATIV